MKAKLLLVLRLGLGATFVLAGALKLRDPSGFATSISHYQLFPQWSAVLAVLLPTTEIVAGGALLAAPVLWRRAAALVIALMMLVFTASVLWALVNQINVDCGCFGSQSGSITWLTVVRDVALLAAALVLVLPPSAPRTAATPGQLP